MNSLRDFFTAHRSLLGLILLGMLLLAACGSGPGESWAGVASDADSNVIYVANGQRVVALDATTGERAWPNDYEYDKTQFFAVPVADNGTVFVGDYKGRMHALDAATGERQWLYEPERRMIVGPFSPDSLDRVIGGAAVSDDAIFFGLGSRNVIAVSRETHERVWIFKTDHGVWGQPLYLAPEDSRATLYVVSLDHYLYALDPATGEQLWRLNLGGAAPGGMTYDENRNWLYIGTFISEVVAVDLAEQAIIDRFETSDWVWGRPALQDDVLYVGDLGGSLYAIPVSDEGFGEAKQLKVADGAIRSTPVLTDGLVVVSSKDKHIYVVNKDLNTVEWSERTEGEALSELVFVPAEDESETGLIVIGTTEGDQLVAAFDFASREEVWTYTD